MVLSVIMPCYNAEKTMRGTIESILNQSFKDFELLLVEDGSEDNTPFICDEFALKDSRVKVFHTKNHGSGHERNVGLEVCKGDFVGFADADDYLHPQMFEILLTAAQRVKADIVMCNYEQVDSSSDAKKCVKPYDKENIKITEMGREELYKSLFGMPDESIPIAVVWNKIYKRETALKGHFLKCGSEDAGYNCMVLGEADKVCKVDSVLYYWAQNCLAQRKSVYRSYYVLESYFEMASIMEENRPEFKKYAYEKLYKRVLGTRNEKKGREFSKMVGHLLKNQFPTFEKKFMKCSDISSRKKIALGTFYRCPHLYAFAKKVKKK